MSTLTSMAARTETGSVECAADWATVADLIADARRIPEWAPLFADLVVPDGESGWTASKDARGFRFRVVANRTAGTADYLREISPGQEGGAYLRAIPRPGGGSVIVMTLPVPPVGDPSAVATTIRAELDALAQLADHS
jgi:hypothetical protein